MNITEKEFHIKLRRLRSVLKFEPNIDVHHRSFIEFLQGPSRSGQYHIQEEIAARRYLELITESLVRYGSSVIEDLHNRHGLCHFRPAFGLFVHVAPLRILLAVNGWQEVLQPLLIVLDKLLNVANFSPNSNFLSCSECTGFRIIRYLLFNVMFFEENFDHTIPSSMSNKQKTSRPISFSPPLPPETGGIKGLNSCLTSLLAHLRKAESELSTIVDLLLQLLRFDPSDTAKNVRSVSDALTVVNLIDRLTTENYFISQYGPDAARRAFQLVLKIYARVPILPLSLFCNIFPIDIAKSGDTDFNVYSDHHKDWKFDIISNICFWRTPSTDTSEIIIGRNLITPVLWIYDSVDIRVRLGHICLGSSFVFNSWVPRLLCILELAEFFRDFHSEDIVLHHEIDPVCEFWHLDFPAKICFRGVSISFVKETPHLDDNDKAMLTFEANVLIFGRLFYCLYFDAGKPFDDRVLYDGDMVLNHPLETKMDEGAWQIIQRCCDEDPKNRPTIDEVVQEINVMRLESTPAQHVHSAKAHLNSTYLISFEDVYINTRCC